MQTDLSSGGTPESSQEIAVSLKNAESPDDVATLLELEFFEEAEWKALGQKENNYGIVENQAGAPIPALVELIVNSYDAILMKNFHEMVDDVDPDPEDDSLPNFEGQYEARDTLLSDPDEEYVEIRADGFKPSERDLINFTLIDNGCGQPPERFERTFLGLLDPGKFKQNYPFLQGQYGMGSSGVLQFCGDKSYKFICSAANSNPSEWSWSLVRQNRQKGRYEYVTIDGDIPQFSGSLESRTHGTFVKVYDYELTTGKTIITGDERFQKRLERYLVDPPLPLKLKDERYPKAKVTENTTPGLLGRIEDHDYLIDERYTTQYNFDHDQLGVRDIEIISFKKDERIDELMEEGTATRRNKNRFVGGDDHREMAILYSVNGQTHGNEGLSFLTNRCKKPRVGEDTIVLVDFSDIAGTDMVDLFQPTRDRIKQSGIGKTLREGIEDALKNDEWLTEEESRRRRDRASDESDEILDESIQSVLEEDPELQRFFESGEKAGSEERKEETRPYNPPKIPDTFRLIKTYDPDGNHEFYDEDEEGRYSIEVPVNRSRNVRFYLNAPNGYIDTDGDGDLRVKPGKDYLKWSNLNNGLFTVSIHAPDFVEPEDSTTLVLNVTRPGEDALTQRVNVEYTEEEEKKTKSGGEGKDRGGGISLPNIEKVQEGEWDRYEFDEHDIVDVLVAGDTVSDMDIYVNVDAAPVRRFYDRYNLRQSGKAFVEERYVLAVSLYSVGMYIEYKQAYDEEELLEFASPEDLVASSMKGLGQVLLHMVAPKQLLSEF